MTRPNFKLRAAEAVKHLRKAVEVSEKDHRREDEIAFFDLGQIDLHVKMALAALEPGEKAEP